MARGWESKSVEAQQDEASRERVQKPQLTPEQRARAERRAMLELTRARTAADLLMATAPDHKRMLHEAVRALDSELSRLV